MSCLKDKPPSLHCEFHLLSSVFFVFWSEKGWCDSFSCCFFFFFFYERFIQYVSCGCLLFFAGDPRGSMSFCSVFICCLWQSGRGWRFLEFAFCVCLLSALAKTQISSSKVQERMADSLSFRPVFIYCLPLAGDPCSSLSLRPVFLCCLSMAGDACSPRVCILHLFIVCL